MRKSINEKYILLLSHLTRGAWIEMPSPAAASPHRRSRTSHEVRGLKLQWLSMPTLAMVSHLTRGAWIEINRVFSKLADNLSRTSHEVRGLKCS